MKSKDETILVRVMKKDWEKVKEIQKGLGKHLALMTIFNYIINKKL
jgi:hypothetical protein